MSLTLNIEPDGVKVTAIPGPPTEEGGDLTIAARIVGVVDGQSGIVINIGPFAGEDWDRFLAYLADPEGETQKQRAREKIAVVHGGAAPVMKVPGGK